MLDPRLRLTLVTDGAGDVVRMAEVVAAALAAGCRCVQVREPAWTARQVMRACEAIRTLVDDVEGLLLVNDRIEVAACGVAHGAQVGYRSIPPAAARSVLGASLLLGASVHDRAQLQEAAEAGCSFAVLAPVWETASKPDAVTLGVAEAAQLTREATLPVVWLGGVTADRLRAVRSVDRPAGVAVVGAVMGAADPGAATRGLLDALDG